MIIMSDITSEVIGESLTNKEENTATSELLAGKSVVLENCNLYTASTSARRSSKISGLYFIWSDEIVNNRVTVTCEESFVGVEGQITGWINYSDIVSQIECPQDVEVNEEPSFDDDLPKTEDLDSVEPEEVSETSLSPEISSEPCNKPNEVFETEKSPAFKEGDCVKIISTAKKWVTGQNIPNWVKMRTLYVRSNVSKNGTCQVSTLKSGHATGVIEVKYLQKV